MPAAEATFSADTRSVSEARRFVNETLDSWAADPFAWSAVTLVSELTTNAVLHAGTGFTVALRLTDERLRLAVSDQSLSLPIQRDYGVNATTGRGLSLVKNLAAEDGVELTAAGKTVWCELRLAQGPGTGERDEGAGLTSLLAAGADPAEQSRPDEDIAALLAELGAGPEDTRAQADRTCAA
ncbi:MAG: hypothetical protein QOI54_2771 [Actinomycetota bacterium]|jgi:anti-sigma regulatory factor (Ser/Thr protein kinase)|nr:hypothetical protein [Actinomycetota bacterium]